MPSARQATTAGRPVVTSHSQIEQAAFALFTEHGFEGTTMEAIASEVGVGRRTLFRYFESKNDIPWGQFAESLEGFRQILAALPSDVPVWEAVHRGVVAFNDFDADTMPLHRQRMALILTTPALQAHSVHQYAEWRNVIADYVARRHGLRSHDVLPRVAGQVSLALAMTAYDQWLMSESSALQPFVDSAMGSLRDYLRIEPRVAG